jgi:hypothetical protein
VTREQEHGVSFNSRLFQPRQRGSDSEPLCGKDVIRTTPGDQTTGFREPGDRKTSESGGPRDGGTEKTRRLMVEVTTAGVDRCRRILTRADACVLLPSGRLSLPDGCRGRDDDRGGTGELAFGKTGGAERISKARHRL